MATHSTSLLVSLFRLYGGKIHCINTKRHKLFHFKYSLKQSIPNVLDNCLYMAFMAMIFPVVMYRCESWTVKKAEHRRIDAFELWCSEDS